MHPSSMSIMRRFANTYLQFNEEITIIDIGSLDINGSYKELFDKEYWKYIGVDIIEGANVDVVLEEQYQLPFKDNSIDVVVSGQTLEHMSHPWVMMEEVGRILKVGGFCCMVAPGHGPIHEKEDYWRILPDGMKTLANIANLQIVEIGQSGARTWNDSYLIAKKDS